MSTSAENEVTMAPRLPSGLFAEKGMRVVCDGPEQHLIATFNQDVGMGDFQRNTELDFNGVIAKPALGTFPEDCPCICGARWFAGGNFHFADGWR